MLKLFDPLLDELTGAHIDLSPGRYGVLTACDGGLLEVSGLSAPVGALCKVAHGRALPLTAEVIGFRNGRTLMMLLGDTVMLRPGARVRAEGRPGMLPVGEAFLGRAVDGEGLPIDGLGPLHPQGSWPAGGLRTSALDRSPVRETFDTGVRALNALTTKYVNDTAAEIALLERRVRAMGVAVEVARHWADGGAGADTITGSDGRDIIHGGAGADSLNGGGAADRVGGGQGDGGRELLHRNPPGGRGAASVGPANPPRPRIPPRVPRMFTSGPRPPGGRRRPTPEARPGGGPAR